MIAKFPGGKCLHIALLILLSFTVYLPSSAQILIGGTLYEKLDLFGRISGNNTAILHDGEFNGPYMSTASNNGDYSYVNVTLNKYLRGKVIVKFDTYADHLPTGINFYVGNNGNGWGDDPLAHIATTSPDAPYMVTLDIPADGNFNSIQMRARSAEEKRFALRELEVLAKMEQAAGFVKMDLNGRLGSSNRNENFNNLLADNNQNWGIEWQLNGVVAGEYASVKVDLGLPYTGYIHWNYTGRADMQAPTRVAFYGYNGNDWNTKDAATPYINTRWEPIDYCFVDGNVDAALANPDLIPEDSWYTKGDLLDARGTDQNGQTHDVILRLAPDKPYRYIMMRVYDTTGNPDSGYNGHIGGEGTVTDRVADIGYMSNFDLQRLQVYFVPDYGRITRFGFTHTHGALSPFNNEAWGYQDAPINEGNNWEDPVADVIEERYGVKFPDFNYMGKTQTLQAAHEKEYDVYVIPGDVVPLVPYNGMTREWYRDGYVRWYNYDTDQKIADKYFGYHVNPSLAWQIPDGTVSSTAPGKPVGGLIGGISTLNTLSALTGNNFGLGTTAWNRSYFAQFHVPAGDTEPFDGMKVAADYTMNWNPDRGYQDNLISSDADGNITFIEPPVNYRAVFVIHDGRKFAEEISGSRAMNQRYIEKHRRTVSAAPGKDFTIRLDFTEPNEPDQPSLHSNIYYKKADGSYGRVCRFLVMTDGAENGTFYLDNGNGVDRGQIPQDGYIIEEADKEFNRFLKCNAANANGGTSHTVKIYGLDETGNRIRTADGGADLQIMEYVVTFENVGDVSMQAMGDYLDNLDNDGNLLANAARLPRHTSQSLRERFGEPYSYQNYDQYLALANALLASGTRQVGEYFGKDNNFDESATTVNAPLKSRLPIMWDRSDYVFPFNDDWGWNHYAICNHSSMTAFSDAPAGRGLFDVSYYMNDKTRYGSNAAATAEDYADAGFFFFADAVYDPGTICRIPVEKPCPGTRIHVSAWVNEMGNTDNRANVIFNFRAKMSDGTVNTIYSYAPGMVDGNREWYHIYFNFVPNVSDVVVEGEATVESYYISVENNCPSSYGADYAVDDIQVFLQKPDVNLIQLAPLCDRIDADGNKVENENVRILVEVPFEMLVRATGLTDAEEADFYFCAIDKDAYEANGGDKVKSIIPIENSGSGSTQYGKMTFKVNYEALDKYEIEETPTPVAMKGVNDFGEECMYFFFTVDGKSVDVGKEIKFCVYAQPSGTDNNIDNPLDLFQVDDACAIHSELRLQGAAIIKMDGVAVADRNNIVCCENQRPVIQLTMTAKPADGQEDKEENYKPEVLDAYYDWFDGEYKDLVAAGLEEALSIFRQEYPLAETYDLELTEAYTEDVRNLIAKYCNEGKLHLRQSYYIFPEYRIEADEEGNKPESIKVYATAMPIYEKPEDPNELLCLSPVEVPLTIQNQAPVMLHGLGIEYPERMKDVPLRVGLSQIRNAIGGDNAKTLWLPVRTVAPVTENVTTLVRPEQVQAAYFRLPDQYVYLVGSNDPRYQSLNPDSPDYNADDDKYGDFSGLMEVGEVTDIIAVNGGTGNFVGIQFDSKFDPREGYYYVLRYSFEEDQTQVGNQYVGLEAPCYGEDVLTLKIVPEYQMWVGRDGDFNNDANWRRVTPAELLAADSQDLKDFVIPAVAADDRNSNRASYTPMDFTKVIVPEVAEDGETTAVLAIENLTTVDQTYTPYEGNAQTAKYASAYTGDIKYDMAAFLDNGGDVQCRPWYHNTCQQIHFNFGAEMINQGALVYDRAWVDLDNFPGRWYYLSLPLQETFAGDFYLPATTGARQITQLFNEITFAGPGAAGGQLHDRFQPAVYQRAWNKGSAKIYDMGGDNTGRDVAVRADWSRVYNDVLEEYSPAKNPGFSVRTDVGYMDEPDDIETVRFRLPKADEFYDYWDQTGENSGHRTTIPRNAHYRLNPSEGTMTATAAEASNYFLVGNPFICHMDLAAFFAANTGIEQQCWIMNDGQLIAIDSSMFGDEEPSAWRYMPPFQGFFVKKTGDAATTITLNYKAEMMASLDGDNLLNIAARDPQLDTNSILVTMSADGERDSQVRFVVGESAASGDVAAIFNADSESGMTAFGKSAGLASSIRYVDAMAREEVGVTVRGDKPVTIRFNGHALDGLMLHDALTGTDTELYDGMEYEVEGSVSGRLFIVSPESGVDDAIALSDFNLEITGTHVALTAPAGTGSVAMQVFDINGRMVANVLAESDRVSADLTPGYYIISRSPTSALTLARRLW